MKYDFKSVEQKWQQKWDAEGTFHAVTGDARPKFYALVEFPYPSAAGLHMGHPRSYVALDTVARKKRLEGYNVLYPMGWDAFGLPTENYAMKHHIHPAVVTADNIAHFKAQLKSLGLSFDWSREVSTTDPEYYKWTQWIFLQLYKHGLAYKKEMSVNFCTSCKVVLANEEVVEGHCERCGGDVVHRVKSQWMLRITAYADRLIDDLETVHFIDRVKTQQINWIGRSHGSEVTFGTTTGDDITVFTTRPDTLFGVTYMVLSPEHELVQKWLPMLQNREAVEQYREEAAKKSDFERTEVAKKKTGVPLLGVQAKNPASGEALPIYISDYVLASYGTGAIMAVPGHDERDWAFARQFGLPIKEVVAGGDVEKEAYTDSEQGVLVNSGFMNGLAVPAAKKAMAKWLTEQGLGAEKTGYKLRDWVFSRQRYWGEPIPMVYCESCGWQPISEADLPLELPPLEDFEPADDGESPLSRLPDWVNTTCPHCGGPAKRETDTMPQWAGSSWYFLRYADPHNQEALASPEALAYWLPVDWYNGGMEHTTLHLLYSRFWHKFLYDIGVVPTAEPYAKRTSHGMILGEDGVKMSKSRGNVVNPDEIVGLYGADSVRLYQMFMGDFEKAAPWSSTGIKGCVRFLEKIWALGEMPLAGGSYRPGMEAVMHRTIKKVTEDIDNLKGNTAIATLMELANAGQEQGGFNRAELATALQLLNPFAPHLTEELWEKNGFGGQIAHAPWPTYDPEKCIEQQVEIALQLSGKIKARILVDSDADEAAVIAAAKAALAEELEGKTIVKEIAVPGKLVNLVVR